jgi:hypothetical protein
VCRRDGKFILIKRDCGSAAPVGMDCGDPLCLDCERARARERRQRWTPAIMAMRYPVMLTLTIKNGPDLKERLVSMQKFFRKFLDLRLGVRNRVKFMELALDYTRTHFGDNATDLEKWEGRVRSFDKYLGTLASSARVRDLFPSGLANVEVTYALINYWHAHKHLVIDSPFIPQPYLVALWMFVTEGEGMVVDIRKVDKSRKGIAEILKYLTKASDIPEDKQDEFRKAVKGLKRVWPLGDARPVEVSNPCPFCGGPACHGHLVGIGDHAMFWKSGGVDCMSLDMNDGKRIYFIRGESGWKSVPVYLIPKQFACHSNTSQGPPAPLPW